MSSRFDQRIESCVKLMEKAEINVLLITKPANMYYLTGDGRLCAFAMVTDKGEVGVGVPSTAVVDVTNHAKFDQIVGFEDEVGMIHAIAHYFEGFGISKGYVGLEYTFLTNSMMHMLTHPHAKAEAIQVKDATSIFSQLRMRKDREEISRIKESSKVAVIAMDTAIKAIEPGITESQIAAKAEYAMREVGADEFWRTYVCSGPRTNIAHGLPTQRVIEPGDLVMIDIHPIVNGYSADICRTICAGDPSLAQKEAYCIFLEAQQRTVNMVKPGINMSELEEAIHGLVKNAGHADHIFGPPIHGVGIEFEEAPLPAGHAFFHGEEAPPPLESGYVIAVGNCGLYTGPWGVRIEDTVLITDSGFEVLTDHPRRL